MEDEYIKFYFSDGWVRTYENDACVMSTIFNYRCFKDMSTGLLCVGFPTSTLSRVIKKLQALKVSYTFVNYKEDVFKDYMSENMYKVYLDAYIPKQNKIEVGDTVIVENANTKELEKFVIEPVFVQKSSDKWGSVLVDSKSSENKVLQTSEVAKTLLASSKNKFVSLRNDQLEYDTYLIKDVIKQNYYSKQLGISENN